MRKLFEVGLVLSFLAVAIGADSRIVAGEIQATEVMMESEGLQAIFFGQLLGGDSATALEFYESSRHAGDIVSVLARVRRLIKGLP